MSGLKVNGTKDAAFKPELSKRQFSGRIFEAVCLTAITLAIFSLIILLIDIVTDGWPTLSGKFITSFPSRHPEAAGIYSALVGSIYVMILTALFAFPIGLGAAIFLEEYLPKNWLSGLLEINIANLSGVPSIVYGLLGLGLFVRQMALGRSVLAGALTLTLLILPIIIVAGREAIRAVPASIRQAAYALGATQWQVLRHAVLPIAMPGVLTGTILALSRAIGETAPLITIGALTYVAFTPAHLLDSFTVMPIQIFNWISRPRDEFHAIAASGIILLLFLLLTMNAIAIWLRNRLQKRANW
jgi:phosphate transport system permease protein